MSSLNQDLIQAAAQGSAEAVGRLLSAGAEAHAMDNCDLRWIARHGHIEVVELLVAADAKFYVKDDDCALPWAARNGYAKVVELFLAAGAEARAKGNQALRLAAKSGHVEVIEVLIAAGAPANHPCLAEAAKTQPAVQAWMEARALQYAANAIKEAQSPGCTIAHRKAV